MATYPPPTYAEPLSIFNPIYFESDDVALTKAQADLLYLRYPVAQGTETLQQIIVNGLSTFNNKVSQNIGGNNVQYGDSLTYNVLTTGTANTMIGKTTATSLTTGIHNTGVGYLSSNSLTTGNSNTYVGYHSGRFNVSGDSNTAIGHQAGQNINNQTNTTAVGYRAQRVGALSGSVAVGSEAGELNQSNNSIAIGNSAGRLNQASDSIAIGFTSGTSSQGTKSVAIGSETAVTTQASNAIAIGTLAGNSLQGTGTIAIGENAGNSSQGNYAIALGIQAGQTSQSGSSIAIGNSSGQTSQGVDALAMGVGAGRTSQGLEAIAIGLDAGNASQGVNTIAIGSYAGYITQSNNSIAIGTRAGRDSCGANTIIIGSMNAPTTNRQSNPNLRNILINATGTSLSVPGSAADDRCYITPIRNDTASSTSHFLRYNTSTKEIITQTPTSLVGTIGISGTGFLFNNKIFDSTILPITNGWKANTDAAYTINPLSFSTDPSLYSISTGTSVNTDEVYGGAMTLTQGMTYTGIALYFKSIGTAATGIVGIYSKTGTLLASSTNVSPWITIPSQTNRPMAFDFTSPYIAPANDIYFIAFQIAFSGGTTSLAARGNPNTTYYNPSVGDWAIPSGNYIAGATGLPSLTAITPTQPLALFGITLY